MAELMHLQTDERTQWRFSRPPSDDPDGALQPYTMCRRMAEDGESYVSTCLDANGIAHIIKWFDRAS
jgi:hypothetical protein